MENGAFLAGISIARDLGMLVELANRHRCLIIVFIWRLGRAVQKQIGTTAVGALASLRETPQRQRRTRRCCERYRHPASTACCRAACLHSIGRRWVAGVTVVSCLANLILVTRLAWQVVRARPGQAARPGVVQMARPGRLERIDLAADRARRKHRRIYSVGYMAHGDLTPKRLGLYHANYNLLFFDAGDSGLRSPRCLDCGELTTLCSALLVSFTARLKH